MLLQSFADYNPTPLNWRSNREPHVEDELYPSGLVRSVFLILAKLFSILFFLVPSDAASADGVPDRPSSPKGGVSFY
jgi:hypothetical protein